MKPRKIVQVVASMNPIEVIALSDDGRLFVFNVLNIRWAPIPPLPPIEEPEGEEGTCHCLAPQGDTCSFCTSCNKPT